MFGVWRECRNLLIFFFRKRFFFLIFQIIEGHFYTILMVVIRKIVFTNVPDRNFMIMCILFRKSTFTYTKNMHLLIYIYIWIYQSLWYIWDGLIVHSTSIKLYTSIFFAAFKLFLSCKIAKHLYLKNCALLFCICAQVWLLWEHKLFCEVVL